MFHLLQSSKEVANETCIILAFCIPLIAFFYDCRAMLVVFILNFFAARGRQCLMLYLFYLIMQGPHRNLLNNQTRLQATL